MNKAHLYRLQKIN